MFSVKSTEPFPTNTLLSRATHQAVRGAAFFLNRACNSLVQ